MADSSYVEPVGDHLAEALAMLARLPLTDAERAEAVRRLLAGDRAQASVTGEQELNE